MISKEYFVLLVKNEHKSLSRDKMYATYEYLMTIPEISENFYFNSNRLVWNNVKNHLTRYKISGYGIESVRFWNVLDFENKYIDLNELKKYVQGTKDSLLNYCRVVLNYMMPSNDKYINEFKTQMKIQNKKVEEEKELGGIYGIYENEKLVYIGMTMRDFEARWEEHKQGIKNKSNQLIFYSLIDQNSKIEFKKIIELEKIEANSKITKRDLQAMELALIQEHKPKYNFAGKSQAYIF